MKVRLILSSLFAFTFILLDAQENDAKPRPTGARDSFIFTPVVDLKATSVKDQALTGTCWCFATASFIESELLRMGKEEFDLSEMFIVRQNYKDRLEDNYLRHGKGNIEEGGNSHDFLISLSEAGIVPDEIYPGLNYDSPIHDHSELQSFIKAIASVPVQRGKQSRQYFRIVDAVLDTYLGTVPETFNYKGQTYTPDSFAESLGINPDDYIEVTSFSNFPFYSKAILEIRDNWRKSAFYNVPVDELIEIIDSSLNNGYTVNWDGDQSEPGFLHSKGYAIMPSYQETGSASSTQNAISEENPGTGPVPEISVTQETRQAGFENLSTTDDHGMHITGIVNDQKGTKYYKTKNSWGTGRNPYGGYLNMSESYVRAKTMFIMVNKNAIPLAIKTKLGL